MPFLLRLVIFLAVRLCLGAVAKRVRRAPALGKKSSRFLGLLVALLPAKLAGVLGHVWAKIHKTK